jgi:hypothetical protein
MFVALAGTELTRALGKASGAVNKRLAELERPEGGKKWLQTVRIAVW